MVEYGILRAKKTKNAPIKKKDATKTRVTAICRKE